ncbi:V-type ATP synthase subunit I [Erysipelothrix aquatica]|uniref:V-type ATP synthase subunit I n=1 Tax=Erysipelothrix aquatica TaxID=2683714 RepID=UPI00135AF048|nr:V-type ATPase 116kDa subunit family protein [Erysipelothrix aquatica]
MAIVKMSEYKLFVNSENVDHIMSEMQKFQTVMFAENPDVYEGFSHYESTYDFERNLEKQEHIQTVLKKIKELDKKNKKKDRMNQLGIQSMSLSELNAVIEEHSLGAITDLFLEFNEHDKKTFKQFIHHSPIRKGSLTTQEIRSLIQQKPIIGNVPAENVSAILDELNPIESLYYMHKFQKGDHYGVFVIIPSSENFERVSIITEKYDMEYRSSTSLHIQDIVQKMKYTLQDILDKRENEYEILTQVSLYTEILQAHYEALRNESLRETEKLKFQTSSHVTLIRGWVETEDETVFRMMIDDATKGAYDLSLEAAPIHSREVPIKLRNKRFARAFEPITNMYSQPQYNELDPTPILAPFYAFFFGMMLADAGYGLVMAIILSIVLKKITLKPNVENMVRLLLYVSIPTMFWGLIYGSFFGGLIPLTPVIDINSEYNRVLIMALMFGVVHLFVGLGVKGYIYYRDYKKRYILYDVIFWYLTLSGVGIFVTQLFTDAYVAYMGYAQIAMLIGMIGIVLTNGRNAKSIGGKAAGGLYSLYGLTNYLGDVVSYSRLMALGLAGASIGVAFNMMVDMVSGMGIIGVIAGVIIFIFGHTFNLLISGLSSYVHSARLTYVEFFGKFFIGGGKPFKNFIEEPTYIKLEKEY